MSKLGDVARAILRRAHAKGGHIHGPTQSPDSIPVVLSPGCYQFEIEDGDPYVFGRDYHLGEGASPLKYVREPRLEWEITVGRES